MHPVGTGPFISDSFVIDVSYNVVKNPNWWVKGKPYLDRINYSLVADDATRNLAVQAGEGDAARFATLSFIAQFPQNRIILSKYLQHHLYAL